MSARVAVVGGTGFVGRHVMRELAAGAHEAWAVARTSPPTTVTGGEVAFRQADLLDAPSLTRALEGAEAVISVAGNLRQSRRETYHDVNVRGMRQLVEVCRKLRLRRVVHVSAMGATPASRSAFLRAKFLGKDLVRRSLLDVTVLRPSAIWGAGDDFLAPLGKLLASLPVAPLPGRGQARLQPIAVGDVARAVVAALDRSFTVGQAYDLPGPEALTLVAIYDRVMRALDLRRPKLRIPYLVLEPLSHVVGSHPILHFTFDQLALIEELPLGDAEPAMRALGLTLTRLTDEDIRAIVRA